MQILRLSPAACEELYHTALPRDFPAAELKPFAEIQRLLDAGIYEPLLLTDDAGVRLAYAWQVVLPGQRMALLDYFAVRCDLRAGARATALESRVFGTRYAVLSLPCGGTVPDAALCKELRALYKTMIPQPYYRGNVIFYGN